MLSLEAISLGEISLSTFHDHNVAAWRFRGGRNSGPFLLASVGMYEPFSHALRSFPALLQNSQTG